MRQTEEQASQTDAPISNEVNESGREKQTELAATYPTEKVNGEQKQTLQQWLRRVPDNPGQLLRNKMRLESLRRRKTQQLRHETNFW
jgi:Ca-activated chloride channel family protein